MLNAKGTWNGKKYDNTDITAAEFIAGIPTNDPEGKGAALVEYLKKDIVLLTYVGSKIVPNTDNNDVDYPKSCLIVPIFTAKDKNGNQCQFRYYESITHTENNVAVYSPASMFVFRNDFLTALSKEEDAEKMAFLLFSPRCENSPASTPAKASWKIRDTEKEAKVANVKNREWVSIQNKIYDMEEKDFSGLVRKAQGLKIGGQKPRIYNFESKDEVTNGLIEFAKAHPATFGQIFESTETGTRGVIAECLNQNILEYSVKGTELIVTLNGNHLCSFSKVIDVHDGIYQFMMENSLDATEKALNKALKDRAKNK